MWIDVCYLSKCRTDSSSVKQREEEECQCWATLTPSLRVSRQHPPRQDTNKVSFHGRVHGHLSCSRRPQLCPNGERLMTRGPNVAVKHLQMPLSTKCLSRKSQTSGVNIWCRDCQTRMWWAKLLPARLASPPDHQLKSQQASAGNTGISAGSSTQAPSLCLCIHSVYTLGTSQHPQ